MYFPVQIKRQTDGSFINNVFVKESKMQALHQFHAFMSTYAYDNDQNVDYVACYVIDSEGIRHDWRIDNRISESIPDLYFVVQIRHNPKDDQTPYPNTVVHVKTSNDDALHQFHAFMSTYAYGNNENTDYAACYVFGIDGVLYKWEIDDKIPVEVVNENIEEPENESEEEPAPIEPEDGDV